MDDVADGLCIVPGALSGEPEPTLPHSFAQAMCNIVLTGLLLLV